MTKEAIIAKQYEMRYATQKYSEPECVLRNTFEPVVKFAMDEWAKIESIEIIKLMWDKQFLPNQVPYNSFSNYKDSRQFTPEQIYELYLQSKQQ